MGDVLFMEGGARNPKVPILFQIACIDTGTIRWVNADLVTHIVPASDEQAQKKAGRLNALPSHDSIGVWMPLVI